jgi:glyoxylase-like metal-dependent hydrolase (beta-lactamase superfamily II)/rhodanese-related sulfurtransferase
MLLKTYNDEGNLTYVLVDTKTNEAVIVDPVKERTDDLIHLVQKEGYKVDYIVDTHSHADHFSGAAVLRDKLGAKVVMGAATTEQRKFDTDLGNKFGIKDILDYNASIDVDIFVNTGDSLPFSTKEIRFFETPGHTLNSISFTIDRYIFTGDSLMIGQTGRLDLPGGNPSDMFNTLHDKLKPLAQKGYVLCPGHDYDHNSARLLSDEVEENPFYEPETEAEFVEFTKGFFPPLKLDEMGGMSRIQCGASAGAERLETGVINMLPADLNEKLEKNETDWFVVDVREPFEVASGIIPQAINIPMGQIDARMTEIPKDKNLVLVCQSGARSSRMANHLHQHGYQTVYNLNGGMTMWMMNFLPTEKQYS